MHFIYVKYVLHFKSWVCVKLVLFHGFDHLAPITCHEYVNIVKVFVLTIYNTAH